jgi:WD40 repeat protein
VGQRTKLAKANQAFLAAGVGTCWLGSAPIFAFGDGKLLIGGKTFRPHVGGILGLTMAAEAGVIITCGDDGSVVSTDLNGHSTLLIAEPKSWLDALVYQASRHLVAVSAAREVIVLRMNDPAMGVVRFRPARAPTSVAFSGDGLLLAIGHSGGVSLFKVDQPDAVWHEFPCTGGPLSVALDQTGGFLFAGLSEPALAGWRLSDGQGFRMGGYPGKPRQLVWSSNGKALLTTGGPALLVWPMADKEGNTIVGPMGQAAGVYRPRLGMMTAVATFGDYAATGWSDGGVDLIHLLHGGARHLGGPRPPDDLDKDPRALTTAIVSIAFRDNGKQVSWASETGAYGTAAIQ